jgi:tyrosine aminotransferase
VGGNLSPCQVALDEVVLAAVRSSHSAGYINACGLPAARQAIAKYHSYSEHEICADNVIVASGCSGALELALTSLLDPGTCLLVPKPGFPLYKVIVESHGARVVQYRLDPDDSWQCDMDHLEEIMASPDSSNIRGILINNPSNPTGSVFSRAHLQDLVAFCERNRLPIVADEVYGDLAFGCNQFHPMAQVAAQCGNSVPVITSSGLAKQFLLPGWRVGWLTFHDNKQRSLKEVEMGAKRLAQIILGACHLTQAVVPKLLSPSQSINSWKNTLRATLEGQADYLYERLLQCHGIHTSVPQGAMYLMVSIDLIKLDFVDDVDFCLRLLEEENVFVLPGVTFGYPGTFRIVFCSNEPILEDATQRIANFCIRHSKT